MKVLSVATVPSTLSPNASASTSISSTTLPLLLDRFVPSSLSIQEHQKQLQALEQIFHSASTTTPVLRSKLSTKRVHAIQLHYIASLSFHGKKYEQCVPCYQKLAELFPNNLNKVCSSLSLSPLVAVLKILLSLAESLFQLERYSDALAIFEKLPSSELRQLDVKVKLIHSTSRSSSSNFLEPCHCLHTTWLLDAFHRPNLTHALATHHCSLFQNFTFSEEVLHGCMAQFQIALFSSHNVLHATDLIQILLLFNPPLKDETLAESLKQLLDTFPVVWIPTSTLLPRLKGLQLPSVLRAMLLDRHAFASLFHQFPIVAAEVLTDLSKTLSILANESPTVHTRLLLRHQIYAAAATPSTVLHHVPTLLAHAKDTRACTAEGPWLPRCLALWIMLAQHPFPTFDPSTLRTLKQWLMSLTSSSTLPPPLPKETMGHVTTALLYERAAVDLDVALLLFRCFATSFEAATQFLYAVLQTSRSAVPSRGTRAPQVMDSYYFLSLLLMLQGQGRRPSRDHRTCWQTFLEGRTASACLRELRGVPILVQLHRVLTTDFGFPFTPTYFKPAPPTPPQWFPEFAAFPQPGPDSPGPLSPASPGAPRSASPFTTLSVPARAAFQPHLLMQPSSPPPPSPAAHTATSWETMRQQVLEKLRYMKQVPPLSNETAKQVPMEAEEKSKPLRSPGDAWPFAGFHSKPIPTPIGTFEPAPKAPPPPPLASPFALVPSKPTLSEHPHLPPSLPLPSPILASVQSFSLSPAMAPAKSPDARSSFLSAAFQLPTFQSNVPFSSPSSTAACISPKVLSSETSQPLGPPLIATVHTKSPSVSASDAAADEEADGASLLVRFESALSHFSLVATTTLAENLTPSHVNGVGKQATCESEDIFSDSLSESGVPSQETPSEKTMSNGHRDPIEQHVPMDRREKESILLLEDEQEMEKTIKLESFLHGKIDLPIDVHAHNEMQVTQKSGDERESPASPVPASTTKDILSTEIPSDKERASTNGEAPRLNNGKAEPPKTPESPGIDPLSHHLESLLALETNKTHGLEPCMPTLFAMRDEVRTSAMECKPSSVDAQDVPHLHDTHNVFSFDTSLLSPPHPLVTSSPPLVSDFLPTDAPPSPKCSSKAEITLVESIGRSVHSRDGSLPALPLDATQTAFQDLPRTLSVHFTAVDTDSATPTPTHSVPVLAMCETTTEAADSKNLHSLSTASLSEESPIQDAIASSISKVVSNLSLCSNASLEPPPSPSFFSTRGLSSSISLLSFSEIGGPPLSSSLSSSILPASSSSVALPVSPPTPFASAVFPLPRLLGLSWTSATQDGCAAPWARDAEGGRRHDEESSMFAATVHPAPPTFGSDLTPEEQGESTNTSEVEVGSSPIYLSTLDFVFQEDPSEVSFNEWPTSP